MAFTRIGGLWTKEDKRGRRYLSGTLTIRGAKVNISIYKNEKKQAQNQPDLLIYEQRIDKEFQKGVE